MTDNQLKVYLTPNAKFEQKEEDNAGYDLYPIQPAYDEWEDSIIINPGDVLKIPTGVYMAIPKGYWGEVKERGSTGSKGIEVRAGVVDCNYRGEVIVVVSNSTNLPIEHNVKKAIAQIIIQKYESLPIKKMLIDDFVKLTTERGDKGFGSTDKQ